MTVDADAHSPRVMPRSAFPRLLRAGLLTGLVDGLFSSVLVSVFYGSTVTRLWQGVASTLVGPSAFEGGLRMAALGVLMHFGVAFGWSAVFLVLFGHFAGIRRVAGSKLGALKVAAMYGPLVWLVMSLMVIPLLTHRAPTLTYRWWVQLIGHVPFVALPIVWSMARGGSAAPASRAAVELA
jgi:hypothetical protein